MLPAGAVLTGAAIKIPGIIDMARDILGLPVQIGFPQNITSIVDKIDDPAYATLIGLINWGIKYDSYKGGMGSVNLNIGKTFSNFGKWFKNLLP